MSRISKNVAEYFPHFAADSRTKSILESRFGNDGYAFWFKLLELLCKTDGHSYDCRNALDWEYLLGYTRVSAETAGQILDLLAGMGKIDQPLWADGQTIWCQALVENLRPSTKNGGDCRPKNRFWGGNPRAGRIISRKEAWEGFFSPSCAGKATK
ncbi:hypothetical protein [Anaeromassilibacillus sp. SJQ-1]|uniref:hypothetical protein n=1 Tax=Anaeromassilibacillus sp. SJQ-1 TaxID=3375419 RepID=UPI003988E51D